MARKSKGRRGRKGAAKARAERRSPDLQARFDRHLGILLGFVPLPEMTQEETDWVFEQKLRIGGDD
jgi:hypothetical protein